MIITTDASGCDGVGGVSSVTLDVSIALLYVRMLIAVVYIGLESQNGSKYSAEQVWNTEQNMERNASTLAQL